MMSIVESLQSVYKLWKVMWKYRWWDYGYTLDIIVRDLQIKESKWGKYTHYVGSEFTKKRIQVLLRIYNRYQNAPCMYKEDKALRLFLRLYSKNLPRFWD